MMNRFRRSVEVESIPSSPWDLSRNLEIQRFRRKIGDRNWRRRTDAWYQEADELARSSGLDEPRLEGKVYSHTNIGSTERYYVRFVVEKATELLTDIFPVAAKYLSRIDGKLTLVLPDTTHKDNFIEAFSMANWGPLFALYFPIEIRPGNDNRYFDQYHGFRFMAAAHELIHAYLGERYGLQTFNLSDPQSVGLAMVLHELGAYTYLKQLAEKFQENTADSTCLGALSSYLDRTWEHLRLANRLRRSELESWQEDFVHHYQPYLAALQIAGRLEKNGWTFQDLPFLAIKIEKIIADELGSGYGYSLATLPLHANPDDVSWRILRRIRSLKRANP
jgi:hypothetical protein